MNNYQSSAGHREHSREGDPEVKKVSDGFKPRAIDMSGVEKDAKGQFSPSQ